MFHFDTFSTPYWLLCCLLCVGLVWVAFRTRISDNGLLLLSGGLLFFLRLPTLLYNRELNPDESQMITHARTLAVDPVYLRSVDAHTIGPLDSYALILPTWLGLRFDYISARLLGFSLLALSLLFLFKTARIWFGTQPARLALLPLVFALGLTQNADLLSYSSELVPLVLLSAGIWLFALIDSRQRATSAQLFVLGVLMGMVPLGKLQGVPLVAVLGLFASITVLRLQTSTSTKVGQLVVLGVGTLVFPALFIIMLAANGLYNDFWLFYIEGNLRYGGNTSQIQTILNFPNHVSRGEELGWAIMLTLGLMAFAALRFATKKSSDRVNSSWVMRLWFIGFLVLAGLFAVTRTGTEFVHYLYFMVGPVFLLMALSWYTILNRFATATLIKGAVWVPALFLSLIIGRDVQSYLRGVPVNPYLFYDGQANFVLIRPPIVQQIRNYANANEPLVVWGWRCDYYVGAQMIQGTAENHSERCVFISPMTSVYQQRYLKNFLHTRPPVFVDAVGLENHWLNDRKTQGHEIIPPLAEHIKTHYRYMGIFNDARLYVRNDRVQKVGVRSE